MSPRNASISQERFIVAGDRVGRIEDGAIDLFSRKNPPTSSGLLFPRIAIYMRTLLAQEEDRVHIATRLAASALMAFADQNGIQREAGRRLVVADGQRRLPA
jgi:hypothetical protein